MQQKMTPTNEQEKLIIQKIRSLSPEKITELIDFVDFLNLKDQDRQLLKAANRMANDAFGKVWDNPEDDEYDRL